MSARATSVAATLTASLLALGTAATIAAVPAAAATPPFTGTVTQATENTWNHVLRIEGLGFDRTHESRSLKLNVFADGHYVGRVNANIASPKWAHAHHVAGKHAFRASLRVSGAVSKLVVLPVGRHTDGLTRKVRHVSPSAATRIIDIAKKYVGNTRYVEGGATPARGFDCSGYSAWAYAHAHVKTLPHFAQAQRFVHGMHRISAAAARPGDLVFYLTGNYAFHVAIYAGHGMQYAAADPKDGIRYQPIWSSHVEYRTLLH